MGWVHTLNEKVADSAVGRYFELKARRSTFSTEVRAGLVTFLTVSGSFYQYDLPTHHQRGNQAAWLQPQDWGFGEFLLILLCVCASLRVADLLHP